MSRRIRRLVLFVVSMAAFTASLFAYRPFLLTDAGTVPGNAVETELGLITVARADGRAGVFAPIVQFNFGVTDRWETSAGFDVRLFREDPDEKTAIVNPGLYSQIVVKDGVLQDEPGPSVALGAGVLLPTNSPDEKRTGFAANGTLSQGYRRFLFHLNAGFEYDRSGAGPNGLWGAILEYPFPAPLRFGIEFVGLVNRNRPNDAAGMIGAIYTVNDTAFDAGFRRYFLYQSRDWLFTAGATFKL